MNDILNYYHIELGYKKLIFDEISLKRKALAAILLIIFIGVVVFITITNNINIVTILVLLATQLVTMMSYAIPINAISIKKYNLTPTNSALFSVNWNVIEKYKVERLMVYLKEEGYSNPKQIEKLIDISKTCEDESRYDGIFPKAVFTAGFLAITNYSVQWRISEASSEQFGLSVFKAFCIVVFYSLVAFSIEISIGKALKLFFSNESKLYKKLTRALEKVLIESYK